MEVLSLFDGMSCGQIAFKELGIEVEKYYAYEIDKYAIQVTQHNFPATEQCGDVFNADFTKYEDIDWIVGGSPCTYWSIAQKNNRETEASGLGWELFSQYVRALHEAKPKYFLYENNKSMSKEIRASIDKTFGFEAIGINSALVSAQNRQRLYWVGIRQEDGTYKKADIEQPKDRGILLKDILISGKDLTSNATAVAEPIRVGALPRPNGELSTSQGMRIYSVDGKSVVQSAQGGGLGAKTGLYAIPINNVGESETVQNAIPEIVNKYGYLPEIFNAYNRAEISLKSPTLSTGSMVTSSCAICKFEKTYKPIYEVKNGFITIKDKQYPIKLKDGYYIIRKLYVKECARLQTVPEWYDFSCISNSQAYKCLGNGWTVEVIKHLILVGQNGNEKNKR